MTWLTWLLIAMLIAAVAAVTGFKAKGTKCDAAIGLKEEHDSFKEDGPTPEILEAFNLGSGLRIEHYEISAYGTVAKLADVLGPTATELRPAIIALRDFANSARGPAKSSSMVAGTTVTDCPAFTFSSGNFGWGVRSSQVPGWMCAGMSGLSPGSFASRSSIGL